MHVKVIYDADGKRLQLWLFSHSIIGYILIFVRSLIVLNEERVWRSAYARSLQSNAFNTV